MDGGIVCFGASHGDVLLKMLFLGVFPRRMAKKRIVIQGFFKPGWHDACVFRVVVLVGLFLVRFWAFHGLFLLKRFCGEFDPGSG